jgi:hypothetical protein
LLNPITKNLPSGKSKSHDLSKINANFDTDFKRRSVAERAKEAVAIIGQLSVRLAFEPIEFREEGNFAICWS